MEPPWHSRLKNRSRTQTLNRTPATLTIPRVHMNLMKIGIWNFVHPRTVAHRHLRSVRGRARILNHRTLITHANSFQYRLKLYKSSVAPCRIDSRALWVRNLSPDFLGTAQYERGADDEPPPRTLMPFCVTSAALCTDVYAV